jgi:proline iminopeptidase
MYANINGVQIFFDVEGKGLVPDGPKLVQRPTLFVLHGGPGCEHSYFKPWMSPLAEDMQLIYLDHRGNGRSERTALETYTIEQMADDLEGLRKHLGLDDVMILGHSFGGMVAQKYALKYPDAISKLVLAATAPSLAFWDEAQDAAKVTATDEQLAILNNLFEGKINSQEEHDAWWRVCMPLYFYKPDLPVIEEELDRMIGAYEVTNYMMKNDLATFDYRDQLAGITAPTLVLAGRHDWVTPVSQNEAISSRIPNARLVVMEDSGHMGFAEEPEAYIKHLRDFLVD